MRRIIIVVSLLVLSGIPCRAQEDYASENEGGAAVSADEQKKLAQLLPDAKALGAEAVDAPVFYGENLWEYIDGAAEAFHLFGFEALAHQDYKVKETEATVDVYDMGEGRQAFGMYVSERSPEAPVLDIGVEGYGDEFTLNFFQGSFYVKLAAFRAEGSGLDVLKAFAKDVAGRIGGERALPEGLRALPEKDRVPRSETFILTAPLGHSFLAPAFMARYTSEGRQFRLVLSEAESNEEALARSRQLEAHFKKAGSVAPSPAIEGAQVGSTSYEGEMLFLALGSRLVILTPPPADPKPLVEELRSRLSGATR
jgi:hypothetical protein